MGGKYGGLKSHIFTLLKETSYLFMYVRIYVCYGSLINIEYFLRKLGENCNFTLPVKFKSICGIKPWVLLSNVGFWVM